MDNTRPSSGSAGGGRLDSWKEIAAYLKRDIRTVQRWEKHEGLPVHRHLHDERGTAYAYSNEIDDWLRNRSVRRDSAAVYATEDRPSAADSTSAPASRHRWPTWLAMTLATGVTLLASLAIIWALSQSRRHATPLSSLWINFPPSERIREWGPDMALSPDGTTLVYVTEDGDLNVRRLDQFTPRTLTRASWGPFFSPDGRWVGFNRNRELMKVPLEGGAPVPLGVTTGFIGAADWATDDHIVYAAATPEGSHGLYRIAAGGGMPQLIAAFDESADDTYWLTPQWVSNNSVILSTVARSVATGPRFQVVAVSVGTGERRLLIDDARHAMYIGEGVLVYWRNDALFATRFDPERVEIRGPHVPASDDVWERVRVRSWTSAAGTLVYWPVPELQHQLVWVDRAGNQELLPLPPAMYHGPRVSPDGRTVAYAIGHDFSSDIWTHDLATRATVRLTADARSATPLWSPDGTRLIVSRLHARGRDLAELRLGSTGELTPVPLPANFLSGATMVPESWVDGRTLLVRQYNLATQPTRWIVSLDGSHAPQPVEPSKVYTAQISPDARWIAYAGSQSPNAENEVYVAPFPAGRPQWKVSSDSGGFPVWARSGRELFYRRGDAVLSVQVTLGETFTADLPRVLFEAPRYEADPGSPNYDVSADDQRFIIVLPARFDGPPSLKVVLGWRGELLRRLDAAR